MNYNMIIYMLGNLMKVEGCLMIVPVLIAVVKSETACFHNIHRAVATHRYNSKQKYKYTHTPNPMGKTSPEQYG